ncbi:Hypothetical predicted protein [Cloeon dipterum]|uniref:Uncharacterized protein n=1 Tax=Cloeon dipterum TaxID=197152 RepID=A0A8S1DST3_9INSE|nr:Hypothetical predicted protein [Cloeon dipterum]
MDLAYSQSKKNLSPVGNGFVEVKIPVNSSWSGEDPPPSFEEAMAMPNFHRPATNEKIFIDVENEERKSPKEPNHTGVISEQICRLAEKIQVILREGTIKEQLHGVAPTQNKAFASLERDIC